MKQELLNESKLKDCTGELFGEMKADYLLYDNSLSINYDTRTEVCLYIENEDGKSEPLVMKQEHREWTPVWTRKL